MEFVSHGRFPPLERLNTFFDRVTVLTLFVPVVGLFCPGRKSSFPAFPSLFAKPLLMLLQQVVGTRALVLSIAGGVQFIPAFPEFNWCQQGIPTLGYLHP